MKALAFDLGDTLVEYEGLPLSWEAHYPLALGRLAKFVGARPSSAAMESAMIVLRSYNTRLVPREVEVSFLEILQKLLVCFDVGPAIHELGGAEAFFSVFRQRLRCFPDSIPALRTARNRGQKIGVFTDVPYGMPEEFVAQDVAAAGLSDLIDVMKTSRDVGFRKPSKKTLEALTASLGCAQHDVVYVGNERKDIEVALAFGCESVLIYRKRANPSWGQHRSIVSLAEL